MLRIAGRKMKVERHAAMPSFDLEFAPKPNSVQLYVNGVRYQECGYEVGGKTVTLRMKLRETDAVLVDYRY